jgi:hypothetical protein
MELRLDARYFVPKRWVCSFCMCCQAGSEFKHRLSVSVQTVALILREVKHRQIVGLDDHRAAAAGAMRHERAVGDIPAIRRSCFQRFSESAFAPRRGERFCVPLNRMPWSLSEGPLLCAMRDGADVVAV